MATNDILPFSPTDLGTNLLTQSEYLLATDRISGNKPGVASARLVNKALRQSSLIAAGLMALAAQRQSTNITDSLTADEIAAILAATLSNSSARFTASGSFTVPLGVSTIWVSGTAAGGGGGAGGGAAGANVGSGGGGGGAGQAVVRVPVTVTPGAVLAVVIGAAGVGSTASPSGLAAGPGTSGGTTSLGGSLVVLAGGGGAGGGVNAPSPCPGGAPGPGYPYGAIGQDGFTNGGGGGGMGASGPFGGGGGNGRGGNSGGVGGYAAYGFGSGGGGGGGSYTPGSGNGSNGGNGAPGFLFIEW